jgi:hypothetical protein
MLSAMTRALPPTGTEPEYALGSPDDPTVLVAMGLTAAGGVDGTGVAR